ncbi:hypothetical protein OBBRIDRAFT_794344 [Obba rivulosa]|uniref:MARVEL domain-containing protein n=1 Tax=Obba rivulosa TaxID=1052685 RepID=A0A8E2ARQ5_9APHY|nr:hypothetical protein OBBRIDRAFT_794344 [Obba rivulosa]
MPTISGIRVGLYAALFLFSLVLLGLTADRIHYTLHLPPFDPLNGGNDFYDPIVAELLVSSILTMFWSCYSIHNIHRGYEYGLATSFAGEILGLFVLFVMWLVGAAIATSFWGALEWCWDFWQCRVLTALVAFAWVGWAVLFSLLLMSAMFAIANRAWWDPMHGRYDNRASTYSNRRY